MHESWAAERMAVSSCVRSAAPSADERSTVTRWQSTSAKLVVSQLEGMGILASSRMALDGSGVGSTGASGVEPSRLCASKHGSLRCI
eukprot:3309540-Pleurochrysis_carterae.AAC.1